MESLVIKTEVNEENLGYKDLLARNKVLKNTVDRLGAELADSAKDNSILANEINN